MGPTVVLSCLQDLANTAWAFATVDDSDEALFAALASAAEPYLGAFTAQEIASRLFSALARAAEPYLVEFTLRIGLAVFFSRWQQLASTAWAFATVDDSDEALFCGVGECC